MHSIMMNIKGVWEVYFNGVQVGTANSLENAQFIVRIREGK